MAPVGNTANIGCTDNAWSHCRDQESVSAFALNGLTATQSLAVNYALCMPNDRLIRNLLMVPLHLLIVLLLNYSSRHSAPSLLVRPTDVRSFQISGWYRMGILIVYLIG